MGRILLVWRVVAKDIRHRPLLTILLLLAIAAAVATVTLGLALRGTTDDPYLRTRAATDGPDVVASDINACVTDMQTVLSDIAQLPQTGAVPTSTYSDVTTTADACEGAQAEDAALQRALSHG